MIFQNETKRLMHKLLIGGLVSVASLTIANADYAKADEEIQDNTGYYEESSDVDYSNMDFTGQDVEDSSIYIDNYCTYDPNDGRYAFTIDESNTPILLSNRADGAITAEPVVISSISSLDCELYKDGLLLEDVDFNNIKDEGSYVVRLIGSGSKTYTPLHFTIVGEYTNADSLIASGAYSISGVLFDEMSQNVSDNTVNLKTEGTYTIYVLNIYTNEAEEIRTTVIHTAPTLKLEALNKNNLAKGPVDVSDADPSWDLVIYRDNKKVEPKNGLLTDSGSYSITVTDKAGNTTMYSFTILIYINNIGMILIITIFVLALAMFIYLIIKRKKNRVR